MAYEQELSWAEGAVAVAFARHDARAQNLPMLTGVSIVRPEEPDSQGLCIATQVGTQLVVARCSGEQPVHVEEFSLGPSGLALATQQRMIAELAGKVLAQ